MRKFTPILLILAALGVAARAEHIELERTLIVTLKWEENNVSVDQIDRKEAIIPVQRGFAQLKPLFYELQSPEGDVYYSGDLVDPLAIPHSDKRLSSTKVKLILPDIPEARRLVIMKRVSLDPNTGRVKIAEENL